MLIERNEAPFEFIRPLKLLSAEAGEAVAKPAPKTSVKARRNVVIVLNFISKIVKLLSTVSNYAPLLGKCNFFFVSLHTV